MSKLARRPAASVTSAEKAVGSRDRALIAALALFDAQGVDATTIEQVRDAAGISIGSLYHHFGNREGLVTALYDDLLERYRAVIRQGLTQPDGARPLLDAFVATHIDWSVRHREAARFLAEYRHHRAVTMAEAKLQRGTTDFIKPLFLRLQPAMATGILKPLPPDLLLSLVLGPVQTWLRMERIGHATLKPAAAAKQLADLIWGTLAVSATVRKTK